MGQEWDHGVPGVEFWKAIRAAMKPGAHLLAFGGTRTFHRLTCAIEDAGFELRDCIMWVYGTGFPKSHDISKAIDKAAGAKREVVGTNPNHRAESGVNYEGVYAGSNTGAATITSPSTEAAKQWEGWSTALKPAWEPIIVARKPFKGTVAANVQIFGTAGINIDACRVGTEIITTHSRESGRKKRQDLIEAAPRAGRWPANLIHDGSDEVVELFPAAGGKDKRGNCNGKRASGFVDVGAASGDSTPNARVYSDEGSAARFFYCAKPNKQERGDGNDHTTVKPVALLRYLCRLVTPPGGVVLDPFMGSGSTLLAARHEGFDAIGIDINKHYCEIAARRSGATNETREGDPTMKKADFKEFTVDTRVCGPTREVQYTTGDVVVTTPALIIKGISVEDAWQLLGVLDQGLFEKTDVEVAETKGEETQTEEPKKPKKKRRTKAQIKADERKAENDAAKAKAADPNDPTDAPPASGDSVVSSEQDVSGSDSPDPIDASPAPDVEADEAASSRSSAPAKNGKSKKKAKAKKAKVGGIDLEQFKSASGLRELVCDFKDAGVESKEDVVTYCTELQGMGVKCLRGVNIERRVANLWDMVA
jgi:site-specific DNA-methyltransferase (adenine-specific)